MTTSSLQTGKLDDVITECSQLLTRCPLDNIRVTADQWQQVNVIGDEVIWWKCPECEDWHLIAIARREEQKQEH